MRPKVISNISSTLMKTIEREIHTDYENPEKKATCLLDIYNSCKPREKQLFNEIFLHLTGWEFEMIITKAERMVEEHSNQKSL